MDDLTMKILELVIALCVLVVTRYIVPVVKTKLSAGKYAQILLIVEGAVKAAEKLFTVSGSGEKKKEYATKLIKKAAENLKIDISDEQISALIESACTDLDLAKKSSETATTITPVITSVASGTRLFSQESQE